MRSPNYGLRTTDYGLSKYFLLLVTGFWFLVAPAHAGLTVKRSTSVGLESGLVGYWPFNGPDISGNAALDRSGQGNNGTMVGGPLKVVGKVGQGLDFDGVNNNVNIKDSDTLSFGNGTTDTPFSIGAWVYMRNTADFPIFKKGASGGGGLEYFFRVGAGFTSGHLVLRIYDASLAAYIGREYTTNMSSYQNQWVYLATTYDASKANSGIKIYLNGSRVDNADAGSGSYIAMENLAAGAEIGIYAGSNPANGTIDEVRVYNRALSADEIKRLYNRGKGAVAGASRENSLTNGMVGYWPFNGPDISGNTAYDRSGQGNHGTMVNSPLKVVGKLGQALDFRGTAGGQVTLSGISLTNTHSVSLWFKVRSFPTGWGSLFAHNYGDPGILVKNNKVSFYYSTDHYNDTPLNFNQWYHLTIVNNSGNATFYLDGGPDGTAIGAPGYNADCIGWDYSVNDYFDGLIDEVRVYNRALTASEVKALYNQGAPHFQNSQENWLTTGLVGYWPFNGPDISGNAALDRSGQGNNGTMVGGPLKVVGKTGQALSFASDKYVSFTGVPLIGPLTYSFWLYPDADSDGNRIVTKGEPSTFVRTWNNTEIQFGAYCSGGVFMKSVGTVIAKQWNHVAVTWNGQCGTNASVTIAINGSSDTSTNLSSGSPPTDTGAFDIGYHVSNNTFPGSIDEVRVYNRALSAEEVKRLYNMGR